MAVRPPRSLPTILAGLALAGCAAPGPTLVITPVGAPSLGLTQVTADLPEFTVTANAPTPGVILMTPNAADGASPSYLLMTDELGKPLYTRRLPDRGFNFQKHVAPDGAVRYSYTQVEGDQLPGISTFLGSVRLLDDQFNELERLTLLPHGDHGALPTDLHDFVYLADGHYLLTSYVAETVTDIPSQPGVPAQVVAAVIQEVKDGRVLFEWHSTDHPEFYANASDYNDYGKLADYMHMNSVAVDPHDDNLIVSFRHQDQVVKLDRATGRILWRLGGKNSDFALTAEQQLSHQHTAIPHADGTLTVFDNGNATQKTQLATYRLDEAARTVTAFTPFAPQARYSFAMGSFQVLAPGAVFIGWGAAGDDLDASEWNADGEQTFSLKFTNPQYESYRALKYPR